MSCWRIPETVYRSLRSAPPQDRCDPEPVPVEAQDRINDIDNAIIELSGGRDVWILWNFECKCWDMYSLDGELIARFDLMDTRF